MVMVKAIWGFIGLALLVHGFFFVRYKSLHPCEAASARLIEEYPQDGLTYSQRLASGPNRAEKLAECYRIALLGADN
jgi:hypothetical protein